MLPGNFLQAALLLFTIQLFSVRAPFEFIVMGTGIYIIETNLQVDFQLPLAEFPWRRQESFTSSCSKSSESVMHYIWRFAVAPVETTVICREW